MGEGQRVTHVLKGSLLHWSLQSSRCVAQGKDGHQWVQADPIPSKLGETLISSTPLMLGWSPREGKGLTESDTETLAELGQASVPTFPSFCPNYRHWQ